MALGARVVLTLVEVESSGALAGRLVRVVPGYYGLLRYLLALDVALPRGFDPAGELPPLARARRVRHLLLAPAPDLPTLATPPDVIGDRVAHGQDIRVFISLGPDPRLLPRAAWRHLSERRYPFLCLGDLRAAGGGAAQIPMRPCADSASAVRMS